jgi:hypothetical protein
VAYLNDFAERRQHDGVLFAKSFAGPYAAFRWPTTTTPESEGGSDATQRHRSYSLLPERGYNVSQLTTEERWPILVMAVHDLTLERVAVLIAWFVREQKRQRGGAWKYRRAITEWEHDLALLKRTFYDRGSCSFDWPSSEP